MSKVEAAFARALLLQERCANALQVSRSALSSDGMNSAAVLVLAPLMLRDDVCVIRGASKSTPMHL
jgi:hypothetical protein